MDIESEVLKIDCPICKNKILLTFNTTSCPKCGVNYNPDDVHKVFYDYQSKLINSKSYQRNKNAGKVFNSMEKTGNALSQIGCALMMIPIGILCLIILYAIFSS